MAKAKNIAEFIIERDEKKCIKCQACVRVCSNDVHNYDEETEEILSDREHNHIRTGE